MNTMTGLGVGVALMVSAWMACRKDGRNFLVATLLLWAVGGVAVFAGPAQGGEHNEPGLWALLGWPSSVAYCSLAVQSRRMIRNLAAGLRQGRHKWDHPA
jgi:hypothetical protein